jgi:ethanolamine utilization protein EutA
MRDGRTVAMMADEDEGGRIFFTSTGRSLVDEDEIAVLSVGVDIGSSTSHLVFSRIVLERLDSRYVVTTRETFYQSDILLTPYCAEDEIDTGALILTGVAVRRRNARNIGELFARQTGKMVAVSAGDSLEAVMAAHGSGAVARSIRERVRVMNVDIGGGTSKIAICADGRVADLTALDVGARLICLDPAGRIVRIEEAGRRFGAEFGINLEVGAQLAPQSARALAARMADCLFEAMDGGSPTAGGRALLRLEPLSPRPAVGQLTFSGGVAEYIYEREARTYGDLGSLFAQEVRARAQRWGSKVERASEGIRATVIGASQYTTQVSGSTIYVSPLTILPLRNVPVIAPAFALDNEDIDSSAVAAEIKALLKRLDVADAGTPVAVFVPWRGSATFRRLDAFCQGLTEGLATILADGQPLVLAGDGDVGGLIGIHLREEMGVDNAIVSVDGLELKEFDYIDIGAMLPMSGAVPVVIKSLIFPASAAARAQRQSDVHGPIPKTISMA